MKKKIFNYIKKIIKKIKELNYNYYIKNISLISNKKYDFLINKLYYIKNKYPLFFKKYTPLFNINKSINNKNKIYHIFPMLSIKSTYDINNISKFINNVEKKINIYNIQYCCELKIDGIAINLLYKNGNLIEASTRGDGFIGENIINNIDLINGICKYLEFFKDTDIIEIRGEIFIYKNDLININKISKKKFSNERNAVSSLIRKKKKIIYNHLKFLCYGVGFFEKNNIKNHSEILNIMNQKKIFNKFPNKYKIFNNYESIKKYVMFIEKNRNYIKYPIDGIVIKINSLNIQNLLGNNDYYPKYMIAYKFNINNIVSKILDIYFNINKYGIFIPIANIKEIIINGLVIKKINLYNIDYIIKNNININSIIHLKIIGEIIPKITKVENNNNIIKFNISNICYSCNNKLYIKNNKYICKSKYYLCKVKFISYIKNFISNNGFNIKNIGERFIYNIIDNKIINKSYDIFKIKFIDLYNIKIGKIKSINIIKNIKKSKIINISNFIYSLNIKNVGIKTSYYISKNINNIENLFYIKNDFLNNKKIIIKKSIYKNIIKFFNNKENIEDIKKILKLGIKIIYINKMGCTGIEPVTN